MSFYVDEMYGLMSMTVRMQPTKQEKSPSLLPLFFILITWSFVNLHGRQGGYRRAFQGVIIGLGIAAPSPEP
jgi:hypothetical protein